MLQRGWTALYDMVGQTCMPVYPTFLIFEKLGLACTNLASQPYLCLCFPCHEEICVQRLQVKCMVYNFKHLFSLVILFCVACAHTGKLSDRKHIQSNPARYILKRVVLRLYAVCNSTTRREATAPVSSLWLEYSKASHLFAVFALVRSLPVEYKAQSWISIV